MSIENPKTNASENHPSEHEKDYSQMTIDDMESDSVAGPILQQVVLEHLKNPDDAFFRREYTGEVDEEGYLIRKDGGNPVVKPSMIWRHKDYDSIRQETMRRLRKLEPSTPSTFSEEEQPAKSADETQSEITQTDKLKERTTETVREEIGRINQAVGSGDFSGLEGAPAFNRQDWAEARIAELEKEMRKAEVGVQIERLKEELKETHDAIMSGNFPVGHEIAGTEDLLHMYSETAREIDRLRSSVEQEEESAEGNENIETDEELIEEGETSPAAETETEADPENVPLGAGVADDIRQRYEETRRYEGGRLRNAWGWAKERFKGLGTFGWWEVRQAERFRTQTGEVGEDVDVQAELLHQTEDLDLGEALEEAFHMQALASELGDGEVTSESLQQASEMIDAEKEGENDVVINRIVENARREVARRLARYRNEFGNSTVGEGQLDQFERGLRVALEESTVGLGERFAGQRKEEVNLTRRIREQLDPNYWRRYVYGGVEACLMLLGFKYALTKFAVDGSVSFVGAGVEQIGNIDIPMKDTIWNTAQEWLTENGLTNPSNQEIMELSKQIAVDNGIGVQEWGISGTPMDTAMGQGHLLDFSSAKDVLHSLVEARTSGI